MADYPMESLGGKTPLMVARTPFMDWMAKTWRGRAGQDRSRTDSIREARLPIFRSSGMIPELYYRGRGPLEAASLGIELQPDDIAFRCNLVTLKQEGNQTFMDDFAAGHITR